MTNFGPQLAPGQDKRDLGRYSIPEAAASLAMPSPTMRSWFLGERRIFTPSYQNGSTVFLSFNDVTKAYVIEVLRTYYQFNPVRIRMALAALRRKTKLEKPLAQRELYAIPEFQNLVDVCRRKGQIEYVDLASHENLVFESFVTSLGKRIQRDGRGRVQTLYPWKDADSDESPLSMNPDVMSGELVVSGTRIPAQLLLSRRLSGRTVEEIAELYKLSTDLVQRVLSYFDRTQPQKYQHDALILFLDDCFCDAESAAALRGAGFLVEEITTHFPQNMDLIGKRAQGVKDPDVIKLCHKNGWLVVTKDKNMRVTHVEVVKKHPNVTILATSHNPSCDVELWVQALIKAGPEIKRRFKKQTRPWYAQFNRQGDITTCGTIQSQVTRKNRNREVSQSTILLPSKLMKTWSPVSAGSHLKRRGMGPAAAVCQYRYQGPEGCRSTLCGGSRSPLHH